MGLLKEKLENDIKTAMKAKDAVLLSLLRMVIAAVKNREIEERGAGKLKQGDSLDDAGVIRVMFTLVKQHQESIEMFKQGDREDLIKKEKAELEILSRYLPKQMSEVEVEKIVDEAIKETGITSTKDLGRIMKIVMPKISGQADGKLVNEIVRRKLS